MMSIPITVFENRQEQKIFPSGVLAAGYVCLSLKKYNLKSIRWVLRKRPDFPFVKELDMNIKFDQPLPVIQCKASSTWKPLWILVLSIFSV